MNFYIDEKKNLKVISALRDFKNRNKIVKDVRGYLTLLMNTLQQSETDLLISCSFPKLKNIIQTRLISANLQLHPSFFILFYPKISRSDILLIPNDKSYGLYSSPTKLLKCSSVVIVPVLTEILNTSIRLGTHPSNQKFAKITPVFKSDDDTDTNNYRPISLLSNFNRVFEKIICNRLTRYIKNTNFCIPHNTAFVRGILPNTQYWTSLMTYKQT